MWLLTLTVFYSSYDVIVRYQLYFSAPTKWRPNVGGGSYWDLGSTYKTWANINMIEYSCPAGLHLQDCVFDCHYMIVVIKHDFGKLNHDFQELWKEKLITLLIAWLQVNNLRMKSKYSRIRRRYFDNKYFFKSCVMFTNIGIKGCACRYRAYSLL